MNLGVMDWAVPRQLRRGDRFGRGAGAKSPRSASLAARTTTADKVVKSVCPYCGVGCAQNIFVKDGKVVQIEGDPDSPVSRGRSVLKGAASLQFARRVPPGATSASTGRPTATDWEPIDLETALDMVATRVIETRARLGKTRTTRASP